MYNDIIISMDKGEVTAIFPFAMVTARITHYTFIRNEPRRVLSIQYINYSIKYYISKPNENVRVLAARLQAATGKLCLHAFMTLIIWLTNFQTKRLQ